MYLVIYSASAFVTSQLDDLFRTVFPSLKQHQWKLS